MLKLSWKNYIFFGLAFLVPSVGALFFARWIWNEWFLFAVIVFMVYFSGACRFLPFKTTHQKLFSIGLFLGSLIGTSIYFFA